MRYLILLALLLSGCGKEYVDFRVGECLLDERDERVCLVKNTDGFDSELQCADMTKLCNYLDRTEFFSELPGEVCADLQN